MFKKEIYLFAIILLLSFSGPSTVVSAENEAGQSEVTKDKSLNEKPVTRKKLDKSNSMSNKTLKDIVSIKNGVEYLKNNHKPYKSIELIEEKLSGISTQHNTIFNIMTIIISVIALFGVGGLGFTFYESSSIKKKYNNVLADFEMEKKSALTEFETQKKNMLLQFDYMERIFRLMGMLKEKNYDNEIFFSDLSQLSQTPNQHMDMVIRNILDKKQNFDDDVIKLAEKIKKELGLDE